MRIVLIGQAAFGEKVLEAILEAGEEVVGVFCPPDVSSKPNALRQLAERHDIPVHQPQRMRDPGVFETFQQLQPDLNMMAFVTDIVPERILNLPRCGSIQYHPSLLPRHRGGSAINWAIIHGDRKTGLTIFWPDRGIDTGPILLQKEVEIASDDTTGSLYFDKLFPLGVEAIVTAIKMVSDGTAPKITQDEALATYEPLCTEERSRIDWARPADTIYNLIRGCNPQPGATTTWRGQRLKVFDCQRQLLPQTVAPGEVTGIAADGFSVAASDGTILVKRVQFQGQAKIKAAEFTAGSGLKVGDRLNT
jgi:methionyl-tRNA formyltransferase